MIKLYNTLTRQKETFTPINPDQIGIYSCGPTVYDEPHIGNLRSYVFADTLHRVLLHTGHPIKHLINITDVGHLTGDSDAGQDKIEQAAQKSGASATDIANQYTRTFMENLADLNITISQYSFPKASEHIKDQIALIEILEAKGFTYTTSDGVYFDTTKYPPYAELAQLDLSGQEAGARVEINQEKKSPHDFALWKFSHPEDHRQQEWPSPWGTGFPGWHIECSAMSMKYLGQHFDIHTGGIDHIPVHHTNEKAQSESATGETFVNYWMHNGFLNVESGKMAKSEGNFLTLNDIKKSGIAPLALRYLFLSTHYRKNINFSFESLDSAAKALNKLCYAVIEYSYDSSPGQVIGNYQTRYQDSAYDDLNTPQILSIVWEIVDDPKASPADKKATLIDCDQFLGLGLNQIIAPEIPLEIKKLAEQRQIARENTNWPEADKIRNQIEEAGFIVKDTETGPILLPKL